MNERKYFTTDRMTGKKIKLLQQQHKSGGAESASVATRPQATSLQVTAPHSGLLFILATPAFLSWDVHSCHHIQNKASRLRYVSF